MINIDNVFLTRLKRVNRLRAEITNGRPMREVLEEAEKALSRNIIWLVNASK